MKREPLQAILECIDQIVQCRRYSGPEMWGALLGEMDQLRELHRIMDEISTTNAAPTMTPRPVFQKIAKVKKQITALQKSGTHDHFNYSYVKIADIYNAVRGLEAEECLVWWPQIVKVEKKAGKTSGGKDTQHYEMNIRWHIVEGDSGDDHSFEVPGEASDTDDKGYSKAISASHKDALTRIYEISGEDPEGGGQRREQNQRSNEPRPFVAVGTLSTVKECAPGEWNVHFAAIDHICRDARLAAKLLDEIAAGRTKNAKLRVLRAPGEKLPVVLEFVYAGTAQNQAK